MVHGSIPTEGKNFTRDESREDGDVAVSGSPREEVRAVTVGIYHTPAKDDSNLS
ncbi:hypothetical protein A2U01_0101391, partial [Trifolium medium]|nr:hypothetical protein [Trifolium medium]